MEHAWTINEASSYLAYRRSSISPSLLMRRNGKPASFKNRAAPASLSSAIVARWADYEGVPIHARVYKHRIADP